MTSFVLIAPSGPGTSRDNGPCSAPGATSWQQTAASCLVVPDWLKPAQQLRFTSRNVPRPQFASTHQAWPVIYEWWFSWIHSEAHRKNKQKKTIPALNTSSTDKRVSLVLQEGPGCYHNAIKVASRLFAFTKRFTVSSTNGLRKAIYRCQLIVSQWRVEVGKAWASRFQLERGIEKSNNGNETCFQVITPVTVFKPWTSFIGPAVYQADFLMGLTTRHTSYKLNFWVYLHQSESSFVNVTHPLFTACCKNTQYYPAAKHQPTQAHVLNWPN